MAGFCAVVLGAVVMSLIGMTGSTAHAAPGVLAQSGTVPPTLTGEQLIVSSTGTSGTITSSGTCVAGSPSTITYSASGVATGPYPGTFTETGTFTTTGGETFLPVINFSASFTINSTLGQVSGTKTLAVQQVAGAGQALCRDCGSVGVTCYNHDFVVDDNYQATIAAASGSYSDTGQGLVLENSTYTSTGTCTPDTCLNDFYETYASSLTQPQPLEPTSKQDCMNGGYAQYGFQNQGQCIAYVEHNS